MIRTILLSCTVAVTTACSDVSVTAPVLVEPVIDQPISELISSAGLDRYIDQIQPVSSETFAGNWTGYYYGSGATSQARCFDGGEYVASVRPGKNNNVVLNLGGGGGCWSYESCYVFPIFVKDESNPLNGEQDGISDRNNALNPLRDDNVVYGDYCDGSVWSGDNTLVYRSSTDATTRTTWHWGLRNLSATISLMKELYPNPDRILVTGASAGGYGTLMGYLLTRAAFPEHIIRVFNDSGPWLLNPEHEFMVNGALDGWGIRKLIPADCPPQWQEQLLFLLDCLLPRDQDVTVALFMHYDDFTIGTSYLTYGTDFPDVLRAQTDKVQTVFPSRFKRYLHDGIKHTIIWDDEFYEIDNHGMKLVDWFAAFLDNSGAWRDLP